MRNRLAKQFVLALGLFLFAFASAKANKNEIKKVSDFIQKEAVVSKGVMNSIQQGGRYYLEIPSRILERDMLVTITILKGAMRQERLGDMRMGYGGDSMFSKMVRWAKRGDNIDLLFPESIYYDSKSLNSAYLKSRPTAIYKSFPMVAKSDDSFVIDVTDFIMSDDQLFSLRGSADELKIGGVLNGRTEINAVKSFPENINFISTRGYTLTKLAKGENANSLWEVSSSWLLLPEKPMLPRTEEARVGYFTTKILGLSVDKTATVHPEGFASRWRLEPKDECLEQYKRGELVEPKKPIVFYISQSVPEYLRPYFIKAVNNWNVAFEEAGFKNAIRGEMVPEDSLYDEGDIRYPLISYKASPIPNAYGPNIADPRSGEIITSHIAVYHSVLDLLQRWYFVMCSQIDERAREYPLSKDLMGKLAETVLTHEVGHTLGLRHNFGGSILYPVDSLRCGDFIHKNGYGASIMDYQRFDYVVQPGDKVDLDDIVPRVGPYDKFAIEWGYRYFPGKSMEEIAKEQRDWVTQKRATDKACLFLTETSFTDPRAQSEDCGDDDIKANTYGMKNLQYIMSHLEEWTNTPDEDYYPLRRRFLSIMNQYWNYIGHVLKFVGGKYDDNPDGEEQLYVNTTVPREKQLEAIKFLEEYLFTEPTWLWKQDLMEKANVNWGMVIDDALKKTAILFVKYGSYSVTENDKDKLTDTEILDCIYKNLYGKYPLNAPLSLYVRELQRNFLVNITLSAENATTFGTGSGLKLMHLLEQIKAHAEKAAEASTDNITKSHHQTVAHFITMWQTGDNKSLLNN